MTSGIVTRAVGLKTPVAINGAASQCAQSTITLLLTLPLCVAPPSAFNSPLLIIVEHSFYYTRILLPHAFIIMIVMVIEPTAFMVLSLWHNHCDIHSVHLIMLNSAGRSPDFGPSESA